MPKIKVGGKVISFPDAMTPAQIQSAIESDPQLVALAKNSVPAQPAEDTRSVLQKARDNFNAATQGAKPGETGVKAALENFGAGGGDVIRSIAHPIRTAEGMAESAFGPPEDTGVLGAVEATTGPGVRSAIDLGKGLIHSPARTLGQVGTGAILGEGIGAALKSAVPATADAVGAARAKFAALKNKVYPENLSLTPQEAATQAIVKATTPDVAAVQRIKGATSEIPDALAYAKRVGQPVNGTLDAAKAMRGRAAEIQSHYSDTLLKPHSGKIMGVPPEYSGERFGGGETRNQATLGQIDDRVNEINKELKSNFRKKISSQTSEANASDADLNAEKAKLTNILHSKLAEMNGLQPEDIASTRQRAGKLRSLAEELELSGDKDTIGEGATKKGGTGLPGTKAGIIDRAIQEVQGGREVIGNRSLNKALQAFPAEETPLPQPADAEETPVPPQRQPLWKGIVPEATPQASPTPAPAAPSSVEALRQRFAASRTTAVPPPPAPSDAVPASVTPSGDPQSAAPVPAPAPEAVPTTEASTGTPPEPVAPPSAPQQTIQDKEVVPADASRGVQPVTLPVEVSPKPVNEGMERAKSSSPNQPSHPSGTVTAFDEETGLPIVKRGSTSSTSNDVGKSEVDSESKGDKAEEPAAQTPESHTFSHAQFMQANPEANASDVEAAAKAAQEAGYEVEE